MSIASITIVATGFDTVDAALKRLDPLDTGKLLEAIARLIQGQTRERIEVEKTSPDGVSWKPNRAGTPTLHASGALSLSIDYAVSGHHITVGSGLDYARIHQMGGTIRPKNKDALKFAIGGGFAVVQSVTMPKREYLGISTDNASAIINEVVAIVRAKLR